MKNQYFGDINDYRKYGILRCFPGLKILVCWMLTPDDGRSDGRFLDYLMKEKKFRHYDAALFDCIKTLIDAGYRDTALFEKKNIIPDTSYYNRILNDNASEREIYFRELYEMAADYDLVFLDADNGLEISSTPKGKKNSSKYLYYDEAERLYKGGCSLLIYQHFPREKRQLYIERICCRLKETLGIPDIYLLMTSRNVFFLVPSPQMKDYFSYKLPLIQTLWDSQIISGTSGSIIADSVPVSHL